MYERVAFKAACEAVDSHHAQPTDPFHISSQCQEMQQVEITPQNRFLQTQKQYNSRVEFEHCSSSLFFNISVKRLDY